MTRRRHLAAAVGLFAAVTAIPLIAHAHDHQIPKATLSVSDVSQPGDLKEATWLRRQAIGCSAYYRGGHEKNDFPSALKVSSSRARIFIAKLQEPAKTYVRAWRSRPRGESGGRLLRHNLDGPVVRNGELGYEVTLRLLRSRHTYLQLEAYWRDAEGCEAAGTVSEYVFWRFHTLRGCSNCGTSRNRAAPHRWGSSEVLFPPVGIP